MRMLMIGLLTLAGMLLSLDKAQAVTIKGNLYYNDGVSTLTGSDTAVVEVYDAVGNQLIQTAGAVNIVTMTGNTSYSITLAPADISGADKNISIKYKLNGAVDRTVEGVNVRTSNPFGLVADIGFTKAPGAPMPRTVTGTITGKWCMNGGITPMSSIHSPRVVVTYADGSMTQGALNFGTKTTYTLTLNVPAGVVDQTVTVDFYSDSAKNRTFTGVLGSDNRVQTIDIGAK